MERKKIFATIEARMGSSRLPGKMALELYPGLTALGAVIERLSACKTLDGVIVATTREKKDDPLVHIAQKFMAMCFRGSEDDVLGRVIGAGKMVDTDALVIVTGDCSCISPCLIDEGVNFFLNNQYDLVSNCLEDSYPVGIDLQVVDFKALVKSYEMALTLPHCDDTNNFEHTNFFIKNHPDIFRIYYYHAPEKYKRPNIQIALDTTADLEVIRKVYARLYPKNKFFDIDEVLELLDREPQILKPLEGLDINRLGY